VRSSARSSDLDGVVADTARIVVLRANAIGDFVLTLPALAALRAAYPAAEITVLGTPMHRELLSGRSGPWDRVLVVPPYPGVRDAPGASADCAEVREFVARQRDERYDLALQLHGGGANSNPLVTALGARLTAGSRAVGAPALDRWTRYVYPQHEVHRFLEVVGLVGATPVELDPRLAVTAADRAAADHVLGTVDRPLVAVHPGASDPRRRWPPEFFATVTDAVACRGAEVVLLGQGPEDERAAARMAAAMTTSPLDLVGRLSLSALVGVLARSRLLIADDSGPRHLAAAVGTATVGVYWCGNVINSGPIRCARHRICVSYRTRCPECGSDQSNARCVHDPSFVADVPVDDVLEAALDLWDMASHPFCEAGRP
jgi:ADP-heptose:LPS heptosyltransferase